MNSSLYISCSSKINLYFTLESLSTDKRIISFLFWTNMYLPMYNFWSENQQFSRQTLLDYDLAPCRGNLKNCSTARNERAIAIVCSARRDSLWTYTHTLDESQFSTGPTKSIIYSECHLCSRFFDWWITYILLIISGKNYFFKVGKDQKCWKKKLMFIGKKF